MLKAMPLFYPLFAQLFEDVLHHGATVHRDGCRKGDAPLRTSDATTAPAGCVSWIHGGLAASRRVGTSPK